MFVRHSVHIEQPIAAVSRLLTDSAHSWFPRLKDDNVSEVGLRIAGVPVRKKVTVEVGEAVTGASWAEVPLTWKASFAKQLFPVMDGKVELAPVDARVTRLTVSGMYEPPLGRVGRRLDETLMHNVAQATVKELAESIAKRLDAEIDPPGDQ
jgi:hypothetical protein